MGEFVTRLGLAWGAACPGSLPPPPRLAPPLPPSRTPLPGRSGGPLPAVAQKRGGPVGGRGLRRLGFAGRAIGPPAPPRVPPLPPLGVGGPGTPAWLGKKERRAGLFLPSPTTRKGPESLNGFRPFSCPVCWRARPFLCCLACPSVRSGLGGPPGLRLRLPAPLRPSGPFAAWLGRLAGLRAASPRDEGGPLPWLAALPADRRGAPPDAPGHGVASAPRQQKKRRVSAAPARIGDPSALYHTRAEYANMGT